MNMLYFAQKGDKINNENKKNKYIEWLINSPVLIILIGIFYFLFEICITFSINIDDRYHFLEEFLICIRYIFVFIIVILIFIIIYKLK